MVPSTPQVAAELEDATVGIAVCHSALSCLLDSAFLKGRAEPWTGAEGTQTVPQLPSMGTWMACKERVWAEGTEPQSW